MTGATDQSYLDLPAMRGNGHDNRAEKKFALVPFDKIAFDTASAYLVKGLIPRAGLIVVWGPPKCGKSFFVFDLMMHVALGWKFRGRKVRQGAVVYCALEGGAAFKNRVEAFRQAKLAETVAGVPFYLMDSPMSLVADHAFLIASIRAALEPATPAAVVIDTLNRSLAGSESDDRDMAAYVKAADAVQAAFGCAAVIIHHCGHEGTRPRGHSSLMGAVDVQIAVKRDAANNIAASVELMKDGAQGDEIVSRLEVVTVGEDGDGDVISSCIVVSAEGGMASRKEKTARLTKGARIALAALHEAIGEMGKVPPSAGHIPANVKCVTINQWRDYSFRRGICSSDEADSKRRAFLRASETLTAGKTIAIWEPFVWPA